MWSDTESSSSESDNAPSVSTSMQREDASRKRTRSSKSPCEKQAAVPTAARDSSPVEPREDQQGNKQVQGFPSIKSLEQYTSRLHLKRVTLRDLSFQSDLENGYVGGWVLAQHAHSYSQGHNIEVFIRDESTSDVYEDAKHLMVTIDGKIVEEMPTLLSDEFMLFLHKARLENENVAFSQDHHKRLVVEGATPRVWIVHKHAKKQGFFQQKTCKEKWFKKRKRWAIRKEIQAKKKASVLSTDNTDPSRPPTRSLDAQLLLPPNSPQQRADSTSRDSTPPDADFSLPDDFSFPNSAFNEKFSFDEPTNTTETSSASSSGSDIESSSSSVDSDIEWRPKKVKRGVTGRAYEYKKLADLRPGDKKVNIFGVVKEFSPPVQSRGTDLCSVITLLDESDPLVGVKCINFNRVAEKLPQVRRVGDIVSLHRVNVEEYRLVTQVTGSSFSSSQRFSGRVGKSFKVHSGSFSYTFTSADRVRVKELRMWHLKRNREMLCRKLDSISPDFPFDLICQVIAITQIKEQDHVVITVWDGTKCTLSTHKKRPTKDNVLLSKQNPAFDALGCGFEQQIVVYDKTLFHDVTTLKPGDVILLHNVNSVASSHNTYELNIHSTNSDRLSTSSYDNEKKMIEILPERDYSFDELKQQLAIATTPEKFVTSTSNTTVPLLSLSELESYEDLPTKCRCHVKVLGVATPSLEETVRLRCPSCDLFTPITQDMDIDEHGVSNNPCSICVECGQHLSESPNPYCLFLFKLQVTDMSGITLTLHIAKEEAARLLNGTCPTSYYQHQQARYDLMQKLFALTGDNPPFNCSTTDCPRPWMECCVLKLKRGTEVYYFMFDTELNVDTS